MGVTGLWQIVQPCARPIKIETLNRKRLAVDASIWIYQFLKAVRDKEGNALRNSHVVGFFRRICKLLFFGIKPVFVFDGGAPALKRQTISARKSRREGRREDAVRTAGKLLAVQMQRRAEEEEAQKREARNRGLQQEETVPDEALVYVDEMGMSQQQRQQNRKFRKKDQYHLPDLEVSMAEMGGANDPRIMSLEELQAYARQFDTGEDINVYDFSKIDYDSPFFTSLPASDRYNILNAARLRSRLRMGHSKEQLDNMFPDRMAFSKFQIERVKERNELTQRLMHLNGFEGTEFGLHGAGRVAGEKGREYVLVKNDGVEGGWALGVISDEGRETKPIDVDKPMLVARPDVDEEWEDEEGFEDIPIEGLNRLPKPRTQNEELADQLLKQRKSLYQSRQSHTRPKPKQKAPAQDSSSLFVQSSDEEEAEWEDDITAPGLTSERQRDDTEDEDLKQAIALSLEADDTADASDAPMSVTRHSDSGQEDNDILELFQQSAAPAQKPVPKGSGRAIANVVNRRAFEVAPESREITSFGVPVQKPDDSDNEDAIDFEAALAESRRTKRKTSPSRRPPSPPKPKDPAAEAAKKAGFSGPLPFEKLDLGSSLLGKKKLQQRTEEAAGGFENPELAEKEQKKAEPLPPWFSEDVEENLKTQKAIELEDREKAKEFNKRFLFQEKEGPKLRRADTTDVIDLEAEDVANPPPSNEIVDLELDAAEDPSVRSPATPADDSIRMDDIAEKVRAEPPDVSQDAMTAPAPAAQVANPPISFTEPSDEAKDLAPPSPVDQHTADEDDEMIEWSESDHASVAPAATDPTAAEAEAIQESSKPRSRSLSEEFEDVGIPDAPSDREREELLGNDEEPAEGPAVPDLVQQDSLLDADEFDDFSDPEEQEMLRALTLEAEEHARFASSLNNKSHAQNIQEYEKELKQLRNQQKKDRRDADEVTHIMITECQQLLRLFGLPYITAPMEAEAQCAELVNLGLVDGIVTDDSDCFLFGGTRIYKNMFNQAKFVECYLTADLEKEFDLNRDKLIAVAHLLGSDYTEGLVGVGPVTALEILSEFTDLVEFRDWWSGVQMNAIPKAEDADRPFRKKFRRNATRLFLPPTFPDARVQLAYTHPDVDRDPEPFQWGVPDLAALRSFLMATIGWSQERTDEVLVPVIRDMNRRMDEGTQANITAFFDGGVGIGAAGAGGATGRNEGFAPRKRVEGSKRMGTALNKLAERAKLNRNGSVPERASSGGVEQSAAGDGGAARKEKKRKPPPRRNAAEVISDDDESDFEQQQQKTKKRARRAPKAGGSRKKKVQEDDQAM